MIDDSKAILKSLKMTAGSRFNASHRLNTIDRWLTLITSLTSAYVIILTILPYFVHLPKSVTDNINLITVSLSIVIVVSSLVQYSSGNTVAAEQLHRSALEINEIHRDLSWRIEKLQQQDLTSAKSQYDLVLQKYSINHAKIDYMKEQLNRIDEHEWIGSWQKYVMKFKIFNGDYWPVYIFACVSALFFWVLFYYAIPQAIVK